MKTFSTCPFVWLPASMDCISWLVTPTLGMSQDEGNWIPSVLRAGSCQTYRLSTHKWKLGAKRNLWYPSCSCPECSLCNEWLGDRMRDAEVLLLLGRYYSPWFAAGGMGESSSRLHYLEWSFFYIELGGKGGRGHGFNVRLSVVTKW